MIALQILKTALLIFSPVNESSVITLEEIRANYTSYAKDRKLCEKDLLKLSKKEDKSVLEIGYYGALQAIWANHTFNPFTKLSTFKKGKKNIEKAIAVDNNNTELRFIRLSIQKNIPEFLNYGSNIEEDKVHITKRKYELSSYNVQKNIDALLKE